MQGIEKDNKPTIYRNIAEHSGPGLTGRWRVSLFEPGWAHLTS